MENNFCVYISAEIKTNQNTATISDMQRQVKKSEFLYNPKDGGDTIGSGSSTIGGGRD